MKTVDGNKQENQRSFFCLRTAFTFVSALLTIFVLCSCSGMGNQATAVTTTQKAVVKSPTVPPDRTEQPILNGRARPVRLVIPAIGIDSAIEKIEILPNGDLATPAHSPWDDTGWYDLGPIPGEMGSAVIDGHLDRPGGFPAVFWDLHKLHVGDEVKIIDALGKTLHFRVTQVAAYPPQQAPLQEIFGNSGGKYLNLITCAGNWITSQHQTTLREVVYTTFMG